MSFMEIKRFVNSGNTPLNTLIGTEIKKKINSDEDKALDVIIKELCKKPFYTTGLRVVTRRYTESVSTLPIDTTEHSSVVEYDGELHLMLWDHYKWDGVSWTSLPSNPQGGMYQVPIVYKGEIHVLGNYSYKGSHYKWNGSSWTQVSTIPYGFYNGSAVVINDEIHILGGGSSVHYKWIGSSWTQVSEFPSGLKAFSVNNELYAYGGNRFYKFDGSRWEECGEGTSSSQHLSNNIIYSNGTLYSGIKRWDSSKNVWVDISVSTGYDRGNSSAPVIIYDDEFHFMGSTNDSYKRYHYKGVIHSDISGYLPQSTKICINGVSKTLITPKTNCIKDSDGLLVVQNDGFFEFSVKTRSVPIDYSIWG